MTVAAVRAIRWVVTSPRESALVPLAASELAAPQPRPKGRPAGFQRWQRLLFMHWRLDPEVVQAMLPEGLEVDCFEGTTYVGVVPFTMRDVSPWWSPSVPGISNFHELNVRTYVKRDGVSGVWFWSLEAASSLAVVLARLGWGLPYHRATMRLEDEGDVVRYASRRHWPGPRPAELACRYRVGRARGTAAPGSLEYFLLERYVLFSRSGAGAYSIGRVHHEPYPFHDAEVLSLEQSMTKVHGFPGCVGLPDLAHYSPGVDVDVYDLVPVG